MEHAARKSVVFQKLIWSSTQENLSERILSAPESEYATLTATTVFNSRRCSSEQLMAYVQN